jgi:pimeloyl-ACP methyl ester carboxylesterase
MSNAVPEWFTWAIAQPRRSHFAEAGGTRIHYASWNAGETHKPALLLAHGFLGHSHWWDFIAPFLAERHRVFALDFGGMGASGHRAAYRSDGFVDDFAAVLAEVGAEPATVVGHSFGGSRLLQACAQIPERIGHAIVLDSHFTLQGEPPPHVERRPAPRPYADEATALERFRLLPAQECPPWLFEHLAHHSLQQTEAGWTWRFDPALRLLPAPEGDQALLSGLRVPVSYVHAERSAVVGAERARRIVAAIPGARGPITLPRAHHHLMLDQPLALVALLKGLLA